MILHPFNRFKPLTVGWAATVALVLLLSGCGGKSASADGGGPPAAPGAGGKGPGGGGPGGRGAGPVPVTVTPVGQQDVPVEIQVVGNVEAFATVTVRAQATGELLKVFVKEGDYVRAGDMLFTLDRRPTEASLAQAQANLAKQTAVLAQLQAQMARDQAQSQYAQAQADRYAKLFKEGVISKDQTEQTAAAAGVQTQTVAADAAAIDSAKADMAATRAAIENVRVSLSYTEIRAPLSGRTGALLVKQGTLVNAGSMDLINISQVTPIFVTFAVPESNLSEIKKYMSRGNLGVFAKPQEDEGPAEKGVLSFIDNAVDMTTGTIKLKGKFDNGGLKLWPGQFVRVTLRLTTRPGVLVLPNQAVQTGQDGPYVYVVKQDQSVESRKVETGPRVDQNLVIESGLKLGETVVLDGQLRLAPGSKVMVRDPSGPRGGGRQKKAS